MLLTSLDCWECREVRNEKFRDRVCGPLGRVFPSFAVFLLLSGELGIGRPCCAAQADRDLSETPPRHGRWSTTGGTSAGAWGVWAKHRGGCSLRDGRGRCAPLDATVRLISLARKNKERPLPTRTHLHHHAVHCTLSVSCHVCVCLCSIWRCGLVSACERVTQ